MMAPGVMTP